MGASDGPLSSIPTTQVKTEETSWTIQICGITNHKCIDFQSGLRLAQSVERNHKDSHQRRSGIFQPGTKWGESF
jgi:hypothetical protein